jgi:hypothetical protein
MIFHGNNGPDLLGFYFRNPNHQNLYDKLPVGGQEYRRILALPTFISRM